MNQPNQPAGSGASVFAGIGVMAGCALLGWIVIDSSGILKSRSASGGHHPSIVNVTGANWQAEVVNSKIPVVVDFWAPWCPPCVALSPTIDKLAATYSGRVKIAKVNVDDAGEIAGNFGIRGIPAVFIFKNGKVADMVEGPTESTLTKAIDKVLSER